MGRNAPIVFAMLTLSTLAGCCKDKSPVASIDRELSAFAVNVNRQLDLATDPMKSGQSIATAESLSRFVLDLQKRRELLQANLERESDSDRIQIRNRIALIRVQRQLELVDRLLARYEQNAREVASRD